MSFSPSPHYPRGIATRGYSTEFPEGYSVRGTRDGYDLYYGRDLIDGEFDCIASAAFAAQDHRDALADEANEAAAALADEAYQETLDAYHALIKRDAGLVVSDDPKARGRARAARVLIAAIDSISQKAA
jgi:hypothetical protein